MIYFIRHGESEANVRQVFAGQKDNSPLTKKGIEQAKAEGNKINEMRLNIDKIISSPLIRAFDTAKIVADMIGYDDTIEIDPRITEYDMGTLTGTPTFDISSKLLVKAKNAENPKDFDNRVNSFLKEWNVYDGNVLMVAHAGVGRIIETIKQGTDPELFYDIPPYPNASVIPINWLK